MLWTRLPLLQLSDLRLSTSEKSQIEDWAAEQNISPAEVGMIPYLFNRRGEITTTLVYTDQDTSEKVFKYDPKAPFSIPLENGDKILSANQYILNQDP